MRRRERTGERDRTRPSDARRGDRSACVRQPSNPSICPRASAVAYSAFAVRRLMLSDQTSGHCLGALRPWQTFIRGIRKHPDALQRCPNGSEGPALGRSLHEETGNVGDGCHDGAAPEVLLRAAGPSASWPLRSGRAAAPRRSLCCTRASCRDPYSEASPMLLAVGGIALDHAWKPDRSVCYVSSAVRLLPSRREGTLWLRGTRVPWNTLSTERLSLGSSDRLLVGCYPDQRGANPERDLSSARLGGGT